MRGLLPVLLGRADPESGEIKSPPIVPDHVTDDATLSDFAAADADEEGTTGASREDGDTTGEDGGRSDPAADSSTAAESSRPPVDDPTQNGAGSSPETAGEPTRSEGTDEPDDGSGETTVDTGFSTYAWGTYTCRQCDSASSRVWRADGELVCVDCKTW
jgi:hypothetical protein